MKKLNKSYKLFKESINSGIIYTAILFSLFFTIMTCTRFYSFFFEHNPILSVGLFLCVSLLFIVLLLLSWILWTSIEKYLLSNERCNNIKIYLIIFFIIWIPSFLIFLNMYPGTLSCDTPGQLSEALFINKFENFNPLINTLFITLFVQLALLFGKGVNLGIAFYTFFQFTMYSFITSYVAYYYWKKGINKIILFLVIFFFAIDPINLLYSTGMWKDTFFSILFLFCLIQVYSLFDSSNNTQKPKKRKIVTIGILIFLTAISRNSAWSSILIMGIGLLILGIIKRIKLYWKISMLIISSSLIAVLTSFVVLPLIGIQSIYKNNTGSIIMQQIARTLKYESIDFSENEKIKFFLKGNDAINNIAEYYEPTLVDPIRGYFDSDKISDNKKDFMKIYHQLGKMYPRSYFEAFVKHTIPLWWPALSTWKWDNRIFDNSFGVHRNPIIWKGHDGAAKLYEIFNNIPGYGVISTGGTAFWLCLVCMFICACKRNYLGFIFLIPFVMIFIGLVFVSYAPLFRYIYVAYLGKILFIAILLLERINNEKV